MSLLKYIKRYGKWEVHWLEAHYSGSRDYATGKTKAEALESLVAGFAARATYPRYLWTKSGKTVFVVRGIAAGSYGYDIVYPGHHYGCTSISCSDNREGAIKRAGEHRDQYDWVGGES